MALKDTIKKLVTFFEVDDVEEFDGQEEVYQTTNERPTMQVAASRPARELPSRTERTRQQPTTESQLDRLHERQQELLTNGDRELAKTTIDIKFPKKYEDAPDIVNLLLGNASILIDFQYMSEQQARRCLDYLDGARSVLSGNMKKVSNTMWLLTPVNVTVHIEELRQASSGQDTQFDFDLKR